MAFEKVKELNAETTIKLVNKGDQIEGFYHGFKEVPGKYGVSLLHIFETEGSGNVGVWGSGRLNFGLKQLMPRNGLAIAVRVTCDGTVPSSKGNDAYAFTIEKDSNLTTEAAVASAPVDDESAEDSELNSRPLMASSSSVVGISTSNKEKTSALLGIGNKK